MISVISKMSISKEETLKQTDLRPSSIKVEYLKRLGSFVSNLDSEMSSKTCEKNITNYNSIFSILKNEEKETNIFTTIPIKQLQIFIPIILRSSHNYPLFKPSMYFKKEHAFIKTKYISEYSSNTEKYILGNYTIPLSYWAVNPTIEEVEDFFDGKDEITISLPIKRTI